MDINSLQTKIDNADKIVFFGGAGVSTESGLKDFRSNEGLYNDTNQKIRPEIILSSDFFYENTVSFFEYYRKNFINQDIKPNRAHQYLARLEESGKKITIITQNVDGLHQLAGSKNVIELHGSIYRNYTLKTNKLILGIDHLVNKTGIPYDEDGNIIKPDVVLYGETLDEAAIKKAINALQEADLLIVAGTSLSVYPAASLIRYFNTDNVVAINNENINIKNFIQGRVAETFAQLK